MRVGTCGPPYVMYSILKDMTFSLADFSTYFSNSIRLNHSSFFWFLYVESDFHRPPFVKHYRNDDKLELVPGMIFTIEPMLVEGAGECFEWSDQWTVATTDGGMAAQFEHTVLITESGVEILTVPE